MLPATSHSEYRPRVQPGHFQASRLALVLLLALLPACQKGEGSDDGGKDKNEPVPVELTAVSSRDLPAYLQSTATLEPENEAEIPAKIAGQIESILVEEGDEVREGQILAELDGDAERVALEQVAASARSLRSELDRIQALHEAELASDKDLTSARATWESAEAQRKAAELNLSYTKVRAPFSGRVAARRADRGQTVSAGTPLFTLVDCDPLLARIHLPEGEVRRLEVGQPVVVRLDNGSGLEFQGEVSLISPVVDSRTGTVKITCRIDGNNPTLRPGSFARVDIRTGVQRNALVIPKRALVPEGSEVFVFRAEADTARRVEIRTGLIHEDLIQVVEGLAAGDRVITVGQGSLKSGTPIADIHEPPMAGDSETGASSAVQDTLTATAVR